MKRVSQRCYLKVLRSVDNKGFVIVMAMDKDG